MGIPGKNTKPLFGKPLIQYTLEAALQVFPPEQICVSTNCKDTFSIAEKLGVLPPFYRPEHLATNEASTDDVIRHALGFYESKNTYFKKVVLLQPTSPLRTGQHIVEALDLFRPDIDMVVSVFETASNPYYVLFEENESGFLEKSKEANFTRRQDCPTVWEFNGAVYVINTDSIQKMDRYEFKRVIKYPMDKLYSIDLDTQDDWDYLEFIIDKKKLLS